MLQLFSKTKQVLVFGISLIFIYSGMFPYTFTSDHIGATLGQKPSSFLSYFVGGRPTSFFYNWISYFLNYFHINELENQIVLKVSLIIFLAISLTIIFGSMEKYVENKILLYFCLLLMVANPFFNEVVLYAGWSLGIGFLTSALAVTATQKTHFITAFLLCFWSVSTYQIFLFLYLILTMGYAYLKYLDKSDTKQFGLHVAQSLLLGGGGAALNLALSYLAIVLHWVEVADNTIDSGITLGYRIFKVFSKYFWIAKDGCGLFGTYYLLIISFVVAIILFWLSVKKQNKTQLMITFFSCLCVNLYAVGIFFASPSHYIAGRIVWPFFAALSVEMVWILRLVGDKKEIIQKIVIACLVLIFVIDIYYTENAIVKVRISNSLDYQIIMQIEAVIEDYEEQTGCKVKYIAAENMEGANPSWPQIDTGVYNYTHKTIYDDWANVELLNFLTGKSYEEIEFPEGVADSDTFKDKYWDTFVAEEQLLFQDDTLYWMIY